METAMEAAKLRPLHNCHRWQKILTLILTAKDTTSRRHPSLQRENHNNSHCRCHCCPSRSNSSRSGFKHSCTRVGQLVTLLHSQQHRHYCRRCRRRRPTWKPPTASFGKELRTVRLPAVDERPITNEPSHLPFSACSRRLPRRNDWPRLLIT